MGWSKGENEDWVGGEKEMRFGLSKREEDEVWVGGEKQIRNGFEERRR